jgi:hypothetical protein
MFQIELRGDAGRVHQIAEHHRDVPALANGFRYRLASDLHSRQRLGCRSHITADLSLASKFEIALSRRIRCPNGMPSFSMWGSVSSGRISMSIILAEHRFILTKAKVSELRNHGLNALGFSPLLAKYPRPSTEAMLNVGLILSLLLALRPGNAAAEDLNKMKSARYALHAYDSFTDRDARKGIETLIGGMQIGSLWANAMLKDRGQPLLYCQPDRLNITDSQMIDMMRQAMKDRPTWGDFHLGMMVLVTLQHTFPWYAMANAGHDTRLIEDWLGHRPIQHTARYTELSPIRFKDVWR